MQKENDNKEKENTNEKVQIQKDRCHICHKKLGLIVFSCKCSSFLFCVKHRLPSEHNCTFDFESFEKNQIIKNNPLITSLKVKSL